MSRFLLSAVSVFAIFISTIALPASASARRCEEPMPLTLLTLYRTSDLIYVGRYEKSVEGEPTEDTPEYTAIPIKKHYSISSALKGETRKMLELEETEYRYKNQTTEEQADEFEHGDGDEDESVQINPGDSVLLFLSGAEDEAIELTEMSDGLKKMSGDELASYEARIRDLNGIFSAEKPKYTDLVAWMIKCAHDPHTRWEGTFELLQSIQNMEWQDEAAQQEKAQPAVDEKSSKPGEASTQNSAGTGEAAEGDGHEDEDPGLPKQFDTGDPNFARNLSQGQKDALTNIFLSRKRPVKTEGDDKNVELANGDRELIELVKRWGDSRVAASLVEQLRAGSTDASLNAELMASIVSMLSDDQLASISSQYHDVQWESEDDVFEAGVEGEEGATEEEATTEETVVEDIDATKVEEIEMAMTETTDTEAVEETGAPEENAGANQSAKKTTYGQLRAQLLSKFVVRADTVIAKEQNKRMAKLNR